MASDYLLDRADWPSAGEPPGARGVVGLSLPSSPPSYVYDISAIWSSIRLCPSREGASSLPPPSTSSCAIPTSKSATSYASLAWSFFSSSLSALFYISLSPSLASPSLSLSAASSGSASVGAASAASSCSLASCSCNSRSSFAYYFSIDAFFLAFRCLSLLFSFMPFRILLNFRRYASRRTWA